MNKQEFCPCNGCPQRADNCDSCCPLKTPTDAQRMDTRRQQEQATNALLGHPSPMQYMDISEIPNTIYIPQQWTQEGGYPWNDNGKPWTDPEKLRKAVEASR